MQNDKILTISIAAYNVSGYIRQTLDSLLTDAATLAKIEVLIVNDGSTDDTARIADEYEKEHPGSFRMIDQENGGYGSTVNAGIREAKGKYFKLLDGDDWFETKNIPDFINFLDRCDSDIVLTPYIKVYPKEDKSVLYDENSGVSASVTDIEASNVSNNIAMHEMAVRTELLKSTDVCLLEHCFYTDCEFIFKTLVGSHTICRFSQVVYCYRMGDEGQSVSINGLKRHYKDAMRVSLEIAECISDYLNDPERCIGNKLEALLFTRLNRSISLAYTTILLQDDKKKARKELMDFDADVRKYPIAYKHSMQIKRVRMIRRSRFILIGLYRALLVKNNN